MAIITIISKPSQLRVQYSCCESKRLLFMISSKRRTHKGLNLSINLPVLSNPIGDKANIAPIGPSSRKFLGIPQKLTYFGLRTLPSVLVAELNRLCLRFLIVLVAKEDVKSGC